MFMTFIKSYAQVTGCKRSFDAWPALPLWEQLSCPIYLKSSPPPRGRACRAATGEARAIQRGIGLMGKPAPV